METEIGLFAIKRDTVNRYLQHFKDVGVEVHLVQMAPLSLCNFVAYDPLNGKPLWHAGLGVNTSNGPQTYLLDGRQFVVVGAGDTLYAFSLQ